MTKAFVPVVSPVVSPIQDPTNPRDVSAGLTFNFMLGTLGLAAYTNADTQTYWDSAGVLQTAALNAGRFDHDPTDANVALGLIWEDAATNDCPNPRDMTNVSWVKTNVTAVKDATGIDGVANAASTLTAIAANGTCLNAITLTSAERTYSVRVKRKTGTGRVDITIDGGTTWTEITAEISTGLWERPLRTQTLANPSIGFRLVTSGDAIEVDMCQLEDGPHPTSEIVTGSATRAANTLTFTVATNRTWTFTEPSAMTTADSRWVRRVVFTNINSTTKTAVVTVYYTDPADNSEAFVLLVGESLASAFLPSNVANIVLWMDPAASYITLNGSDVSNWSSREGNTDYAQATATKQPTHTGITLGGAQAIRFDGANGLISDTAGEPVYSIGTGGFYIAAVFSVVSSINTRQTIWGEGGNPDLIVYAISFNSASSAGVYIGTTHIAFSSLAISSATDYVVEFWRDGTSVRCRVNGTIDTDTVINSENVTTLGPDTSGIGVRKPTDSSLLDGDLGDVLMYDELPSSADRDQIKNYLADKYSITVA